MNKKGFTLAEMLVTLGIIGVVAAISVPMLSSLMPNQEKMKVLKYYKVLNDVNKELINNPSLYWTPAGNDCVGYECTQQPLDPRFSDDEMYSGKTKFGALLAAHLDCEDITFYMQNDGYFEFILSDGSRWGISWKQHGKQAEIMIDINGKDNPPGTFYYGDAKKVDKYCFALLTEDAIIKGNDPLSVAYLKNSSNFKNKKEDYKTADADNAEYRMRDDSFQD